MGDLQPGNLSKFREVLTQEGRVVGENDCRDLHPTDRTDQADQTSRPAGPQIQPSPKCFCGSTKQSSQELRSPRGIAPGEFFKSRRATRSLGLGARDESQAKARAAKLKMGLTPRRRPNQLVTAPLILLGRAVFHLHSGEFRLYP